MTSPRLRSVRMSAYVYEFQWLFQNNRANLLIVGARRMKRSDDHAISGASRSS